MNEHVESVTVETQIKILETVRICTTHYGIAIQVYCGLRTCETQAKLYRQSRTRPEIMQKVQSYNDKGFPMLGEALMAAGPQSGVLGKHVTKAGPGESWHQYGEAVDCVPVKNGKAIWESDEPEWEIFGSAAEHCGLHWSGRWKKFKETAHVQVKAGGNPLSSFRDEIALFDALTRANSI
tara:strand:+ start:4414 stop:4953 length:540 start_codon:yes stop_codon:yes gene_type:complete